MKFLYFLLLLVLMACQNKSQTSQSIPTDPEVFLAELIPENQIAHAGVFSADQTEYYYTLSDIEFYTFTVMSVRLVEGEWTDPDTAFFNSEYSEHGVHFTPDGRNLYFSSTRPVGSDTIPDTWHIWSCKKTDSVWGTPEVVTIPGLSQKLVSHPTSTKTGRLYFHAGNTDYSDLCIYFSDQKNGEFSEAKKLNLPGKFNTNCITPFVSPDESYLLFAKVKDNQEILYISQRTNEGWSTCKKLSDKVNTNNLGNPYITSDGNYLYFATGEMSAYGLPFNWVIRRISAAAVLP